ncbi:MAG: hypothetical protein M1313_09140 [Nitrospirae bacterium]|nr:hypothetical protein [Nitrospirota bacterium]
MVSEVREREITAVRRILPLLAKDLWPGARRIQKKWTAWLGPTNSGKTHEALGRLRKSGGSYLAPLRLLAQEVHERFESEGIPTTLHTGEERIHREEAIHVSATVEMGSTTREDDCVVIDEIQMLSDRERGHAWVRALLGSPVEEVLLCGAPQSEGALRRLADYAGVSLEIHRTDRKTPLTLSPDPIPPGQVPDGSIVVAFSRMDVLDLARLFRDRGRPVATIYGAMPPELRRAESRRFRSGEATVMLATDAVGMGLNIPAEYVIFSTATKFDGKEDRLLTPDEVLQIGGRAGRFGLHRQGIVAGMDRQTHALVRRQFSGEPPPISGPFPFMPDFPIVQSAAAVLASENLETLLSRLHASILTDAHLRSGIGPEVRQRASRIEQSCPGLPLDERWLLLFAPVNRTTEFDFWRWVATVGRGGGPAGTPVVRCPPAREIHGRKEGEETLARLSLYRWLSLRFPHRFPEYDVALGGYLRVLEETRVILEREGRARRRRKQGVAE